MAKKIAKKKPTALAIPIVSSALEQTLIAGNLSGLNETQRLEYCKAICAQTGMSLLTRPFEYIKFQGSLVLYVKPSACEQLRKIHGVSIEITKRERVSDLLVVTAKAIDKTGRMDEAIGAVNLQGLMGEAAANAMMKAETKAKRRVTLSMCGLGYLDESEIKMAIEAQSKRAVDAQLADVEQKLEIQEPEKTAAINPLTAAARNFPEASVDEQFTLEAGKLKGKDVRDLPDKKLSDWIRFYESSVEKGTTFDEAVTRDSYKVRAEIDGREFDKQRGEK